MELTKKEIKELCKKAGCYCPAYEQILTEYANTPEYLRQYIKGLGRKELISEEKIKISKELDKFIGYSKKVHKLKKR